MRLQSKEPSSVTEQPRRVEKPAGTSNAHPNAEREREREFVDPWRENAIREKETRTTRRRRKGKKREKVKTDRDRKGEFDGACWLLARVSRLIIQPVSKRGSPGITRVAAKD